MQSHLFYLSSFFLLFVNMFSCRPLEVILWETVLKVCSRFTREDGCRKVISINLLCIYMEITLCHMCSPVNLLQISGHLFIRTPLKDCFCLFKLWFISFCITSLILRIIWASSINWSIEAATGRLFTKKLYCIFTEKLLKEVEVLVVLYAVNL